MTTETTAFTVVGKVHRIDTFTSKAGKEIITLILAVEGQYPQLIPAKFFGRVAADAKALKLGAVVKVEGRLGGREYNGKVYGDNIGESIDILQQPSDVGRDEPPPPQDDDIPF